jgi:hypothetical protein
MATVTQPSPSNPHTTPVNSFRQYTEKKETFSISLHHCITRQESIMGGSDTKLEPLGFDDASLKFRPFYLPRVTNPVDAILEINQKTFFSLPSGEL